MLIFSLGELSKMNAGEHVQNATLHCTLDRHGQLAFLPPTLPVEVEDATPTL